MSRKKPAPKAAPEKREAWTFPQLRRDWPHLLGVFASSLAVYVYSMPRTLTLEDSGIFIMSANVAGVSHPPGYPLHSLLGKLFTLLPWGSVPMRVHLLSAVFAAAACAVLWYLCVCLTGKKVAAWGAALGFAVSRELWAQSIIAEVYSLNVFLCLMLVALGLHYRATKARRTVSLLGLVAGLSLAHHWPLAVLAFPGVAILLWPARRELFSQLPRAAAFVLLGLAPYAWMVFRSNQNPLISFYGPLDSFDRFWFFVSRKGYADADTNLGATALDQLKFAWFFLGEALWQLTPLGAALGLAGMVLQRTRWPASVVAALGAVFLGASLVLVLLLNRRHGHLEQAVFKVYPLMPYAVLCLWAALALAELETRLATWWPRAALAVSSAVAAALVLATLGAGWRTNVRRDDTWARDYAQTVLEAVEPSAIVIAGEDTDTGPLGYLHHVEGVRPDIELYNAEGLIFSNRLFRIPVSPSEKASAIKRLIDGTNRPVYLVSETPNPYGTVEYGLFRKVVRAEGTSYAAAPGVVAYCARIAGRSDLTDTWSIDHRHRLLRRCGLVLAGLVLKTSPPREDLRPVLNQVATTFTGKLGLAEAMATTATAEQLLAWTSQAEPLLDPTVPNQGLATLYYLRGFALYRTDLKAGLAAFETSLGYNPEPTNGAALALLQLYAGSRDRAKYWEVHERVFGKHTPPAEIRELDKTVGR